MASAFPAPLPGFTQFPPPEKRSAVVARESKQAYNVARALAAAEVSIAAPAVPDRRRAACADLATFLRTYFPAEFSRDFDPNMREVMRLATEAIEQGGRFACVLPRGSGKTVTLTRAALWAVLSGRRRFIVILGANDASAARLLEMLGSDLAGNTLLHADFPEVCEAFRVAGGQAARLRSLRHEGELLHAGATRDRIVFPTVGGEASAARGQILLARGLTGAMRGLSHALPDGQTLRPDLCLIDDPQTDESAASASQTAKREALISGSVMGLAGPQSNIAVLVAATVIRKDDLAERLLTKHPEFEARRFPLVERWPDSKLWDHYDALLREKRRDEATAFYAAHRAEMDRGAVVPCAWRVRPGELSALQTAHNLRFEMGEDVFAVEMQGEPPRASVAAYELAEAQVLCNVLPQFPQFAVPPSAAVLVGHTDINRSGLHWCVAAFQNDLTAHVVAYGNITQAGGLWPESAPAPIRGRCIAAALARLVQMLGTPPFRRNGGAVRLSLFLIDAGFEADVVHRFVEMGRIPFPAYAAIGRAAHKYGWHRHNIVGRAAEMAHLQRTERWRLPYAVYNADHWRAVSQRAWFGAPGTPGALTLFSLPSLAGHREFAEHVTAEKLSQTYETEQGLRYEWHHQPGSAWDWGDAVTGCYAAAALAGLNSAGVSAAPAEMARAARTFTPRPPRRTRIRILHGM